jgi:hypothetical protein
MTYLKAESMRQEMIVAMQYKDMFPDRYIEIAKNIPPMTGQNAGRLYSQKRKKKKLPCTSF